MNHVQNKIERINQSHIYIKPKKHIFVHHVISYIMFILKIKMNGKKSAYRWPPHQKDSNVQLNYTPLFTYTYAILL